MFSRHSPILGLMTAGLIAGSLSSCTTPDDTSPASGCETSPGFVGGGLLAEPAVFITSEALRVAFERYAQLHTVAGIPTKVVTLEEICGGGCNDGDPTQDTASAIKNFIISQPQIQHVILGGDSEIVPSRLVHDRYTSPLGDTFEDDFYTDYYYSDLSEWDTNHDGVYADDAADNPDLRPEVSVARIPVSTPEEAEIYRVKVIQHLSAYPSDSVRKALLLSNVAGHFGAMQIDGAIWFETEGRTISVLRDDVAVRKVYATDGLDDAAEILTVEGEGAAIAGGHNLVIHSGHGAESMLTCEVDGTNAFTGEMAYGLSHDTYPIFLSCACLAGNFAYGGGDSAGEQLVNAPGGGAIAYLGNTVVGLGLAGGMQLIDELLRHVQYVDQPLLADAYRAAHQNLPESDIFQLIIEVPVIEQNSYEWTQKAVVLLGDSLIPIYTQPLEAAPAVELSSEVSLCEGRRLTFTISPPELVGTFRLQIGESYLELPDASGAITVDTDGTGLITAGFAAPGHYLGYTEIWE